MMLPALALLVGRRPEHRFIALAAFVVLALPTPYALFDHRWPIGDPAPFNRQANWPQWASVVDHAFKPVPVLALWAWLCARSLARGRDAEASL
jgi:hypothetical protein